MGDKFVKKYPDGILKEMSLPLPLGLTRCSVDTLHLADDIQQLRVFVAVAHKLVVDLKACIHMQLQFVSAFKLQAVMGMQDSRGH